MTGKAAPETSMSAAGPEQEHPHADGLPEPESGSPDQKRYSSGLKSRPRVDNKPSHCPSNAPLFAAIPEDPQPKPMTSSVGTPPTSLVALPHGHRGVFARGVPRNSK